MKNPTISEVLIIGGVSPSDQLKRIENGVDIVVATPGRIDDFISSGKVNTSRKNNAKSLSKHISYCSSVLTKFGFWCWMNAMGCFLLETKP